MVIAELKKLSQSVKDKKEISQMGTIATNGDQVIGDLTAEAMENVGKDGVITVEEAKTVVEDMQFDRGYLSPSFVSNAETMEAVLEEPLWQLALVVQTGACLRLAIARSCSPSARAVSNRPCTK